MSQRRQRQSPSEPFKSSPTTTQLPYFVPAPSDKIKTKTRFNLVF